jgi:chemotaxis family two-component system sensor kinase Cph1
LRNVIVLPRLSPALPQYRPINNNVILTFIEVSSSVAAEEKQKMLAGELNHRVKNTLTVVCSIVERTLPESEAKRTLLGRLHVLAQTNDLLMRAQWADLPLYDLIATELAPYAGAERGAVRIDGPPILLKPRAALTLALAIHELATNAAKYGALSVEAGRVTVSWTRSGGDPAQLRLLWIEKGGPQVTSLSKRGFGTELIERGISYDLHGEARLEIAEGAVRCTITIPESPEPPFALAADTAEQGEETQEKRRILVVEDSHLNAKLIAEILQLAGWQVVGPIGHLTEAMEVAASHQFEAAVLDVRLGREAVYPVAEVLNERRIPFAFLTGYDAEALPRPFCEQPRLGKPFKPAELIGTVARLVAPAAQNG